MGCTDGIIKGMISNCTTTPAGGAEVKAWMVNRSEITFTYDGTTPNKITAAVMATGKQAWPILGVKDLHNGGFDGVMSNNRPDRYTHMFATEGFEIDAESLLNMDNANDVVVIVERKNKGVDGGGAFIVLGAKNGLYKSADSSKLLDADGARPMEWTSMETAPEPYSFYVFDAGSYADTLAAIEALETPAT